MMVVFVFTPGCTSPCETWSWSCPAKLYTATTQTHLQADPAISNYNLQLAKRLAKSFDCDIELLCDGDGERSVVGSSERGEVVGEDWAGNW